MASGVNAVDRERDMLRRLADFGREVDPWDCQAWLLQAMLLRTLERHEEADRACEKARETCTSTRDRGVLEKAVSRGTCR